MESYISIIIVWTIGFVLLSAAWGKARSFSQFKLNLVESFDLSKALAGIAAPILIFIELIIAALIIISSSYTDLAMVVALVMFTIFTLFLINHWSKNARVKCNCFGEEDRPVSTFDLARNTLLIIFIVIYLLNEKNVSDLSIELNIMAAGLGMVLSIVVIHLHDIATLFLSARGKF